MGRKKRSLFLGILLIVGLLLNICSVFFQIGFPVFLVSATTAPVVTTNETTNIEERSGVFNGYVEDGGGESPTIWFEAGNLSDTFFYKTINQTVSDGSEFSNSFSGELKKYANMTNHAVGSSGLYSGWGAAQVFLSEGYEVSSVAIYIKRLLNPQDIYIQIFGAEYNVSNAAFKPNSTVYFSKKVDTAGMSNVGKWYEVDVSGVWLDPGTHYALSVNTSWDSVFLDSVYWWAQISNPYPYGVHWFSTENCTNWQKETFGSGIDFTFMINGTSQFKPGTLHVVRSVGNNSYSTTHGNYSYFLTKPVAVFSDFTISNAYSSQALRLSWTPESNATYIERNTVSSWSRGAGTLVYNGSGSMFNDTGLGLYTAYYYRAWSYVNWTKNSTYYQQFSDNSIMKSNSTRLISPPILSVYVSANNSFSPTPRGWINITVSGSTDTVDLNTSVNDVWVFNGTVDDGVRTSDYYFDLSLNNSNYVHIIATDLGGNVYNYSYMFTIYVCRISFVNERNGTWYNWNRAISMGNLTNANLTIPEINYTLDLFTTHNRSFNFTSVKAYTIYIAMKFELISDYLIRTFDTSLLDYNSRIGLVELQEQLYEQLVYSVQRKPVWIKNLQSDSYIAVGYTSRTYGSTYTLSAYTVNMLYCLYTEDNGRRIYLASIDGSRSAQINVDFLEFSNISYNFTILKDYFGISRYNNYTYMIYYRNPSDDAVSVKCEIIDGSTTVFSYTEVFEPNNFTLYFNYATLNISSSVLEVRLTVTDDQGNVNVLRKYINLETGQITEIPAALIAIISIGIFIFGITFVSSRNVFGTFGIFITVTAIAVTAFAEQVWFITLLQVVEVLCLIFILLTYKEHGRLVT